MEHILWGYFAVPRGVHASKRVIATMSPTIFKLIKQLARTERRTLSQMLTTLAIEAMQTRGIDIPLEPDDDDDDDQEE